MKKSELIEKLNDYIEEESIQHEDVDIGDESLSQIKNNFEKLSKYFVSIFNEFRSNFIDCKDQYVSDLILNLSNISLDIVSFNQDVDSSISFGKSIAKEELNNYIKKNYYIILDFCNLYEELFQ